MKTVRQGELFGEVGFKESKQEVSPEILSFPEVKKSASVFERIQFTITLDKLIVFILFSSVLLVGVYSLGLAKGARVSHSQKEVVEDKAIIEPSRMEQPDRSDQLKVIATTPAVDNFYTIQVVTYRRESLAVKEAERLREKGAYSFIVPSGNYYQVCMNLYPQKSQALDKLTQLEVMFRSQYPDAFVRPLKR